MGGDSARELARPCKDKAAERNALGATRCNPVQPGASAVAPRETAVRERLRDFEDAPRLFPRPMAFYLGARSALG